MPGKHIVAGDFNCVLQPSKDQSSGIDNTHVRSRKALQYHCKKNKKKVEKT